MGEFEIMFQQPGGQPEAEKKAADDRPAAPAAGWAGTASDGDTGSAEKVAGTPAKVGRPRTQRARKNQEPVFPVHTVTPHPLAVQRAQEILDASGGTYTKILPGDEPGTIIIR